MTPVDTGAGPATGSGGEIRLVDLMGLPAAAPDGTPIGRLDDLTLRIGDGDAVVDRVVVRSGRRERSVAGWDAVVSIGEEGVVLDPAKLDPTGASASTPELAGDELLLVRDVLDTQIVDLDGRRLARVGDVILGRTAGGRLVAVAVETGFGSVCRRIGARRLARHFAERAVPWQSMHLTSARGHEVQLATPTAALHRLDAAEVGLLLDAVTTSAAVDIVRAVHPDIAASALAASHPHTAGRLIRSLHRSETDHLLGRMPRAHATRLARHRSGGAPDRRLRRHDGWRRRVPARRDER